MNSCAKNIDCFEDFVIYGTQFTNSTEYQNSFLKGRYRIGLRGIGPLVRKTEWDYLENGGFKILIPGFVISADSIITGEFY